ncbi:hypothetical protein NL676_026902 [Syzygium grande]|nr:hypothetical protein NL676_026902 [Syzygium grande]
MDRLQQRLPSGVMMLTGSVSGSKISTAEAYGPTDNSILNWGKRGSPMHGKIISSLLGRASLAQNHQSHVLFSGTRVRRAYRNFPHEYSCARKISAAAGAELFPKFYWCRIDIITRAVA